MRLTAYNIYRGTSAGQEPLYFTLGNYTSYSDSNISNSQTYYYKVSAVNQLGEGLFSNEVNVTTNSVPTVPLALQAIPGDGIVSLTWSPPKSNGNVPITGYNIYRSTIQGNETILTAVQNVTSFTDEVLVNGQIYYYKVSAINGVGEGNLSAEIFIVPTANPLNAQLITTLNLTIGLIILFSILGSVLFLGIPLNRSYHQLRKAGGN